MLRWELLLSGIFSCDLLSRWNELTLGLNAPPAWRGTLDFCVLFCEDIVAVAIRGACISVFVLWCIALRDADHDADLDEIRYRRAMIGRVAACFSG